MSKHVHADGQGGSVSCYHECVSYIADWKFWFGITITYPIEHFIWEHIPGLSTIAHWLKT